MAAVAPRRRHKRPLVVGHKMHCPRCKKLQDILTFKAFMEIEEFSDETVPIYECKLCRWTFAPVDSGLYPHSDEERFISQFGGTVSDP